MYYSQLCDRSLVAYLAYLAVVSCNGERAGQSLLESGRVGVDESVGGGDDNGNSVVRVFGGLLAEARGSVGDLGDVGSDGGVGGGFDRLIDFGAKRRAESNVRVAGSDDGNCVGGVDGGDRAERDGQVDTEPSAASAARSAERVDLDEVGASFALDGQRQVDVRGKNWERNREWKRKKRAARAAKKGSGEVPAWRVGAKPLSPPSTVVTVDSRTAEEIEAARTLAVRRTFENRLAVARTKYQLSSFADKTKSEAIRRLEVARLEEKFNTTKAKSQASYKKCASPLDSVGSAGSAGEFAWKQEIRKRDAVQMKSDYFEKQLEKAMLYLSDEGKRAIAEIPEPYIPSDEDIAAEDADICPYLSYEEMEAEAEKFIGVGVRW